MLSQSATLGEEFMSEDAKLRPGSLPWKCTSCGAKLGMLDAGRDILTIKVKDTYIWINGGNVSMTCRNCGSIDSLEQMPGSVELPTVNSDVPSSDV